MDKNKNYYEILGVTHNSTNNEIKKAYYKLSKCYHPDKNKDIDTSLFNSITESYDVFCNEELRKEYDMKSKYGKDYNEYYELFDITNDFSYSDGKEKFDKFKKYEVNNIDIVVKDDFNGNIEYERWVKCKSCDGTGKNLSSKIIIRDNNGNIMKMFDGDDGCDFCFEENNFVITKRGAIKINKISTNDVVLSKNNDYYEVIQLMSRIYSGDIYDINVAGIEINGVTPNHKFNIVRFNRNKYGRIKIDDYEILEVSSKYLTNNDFILYQKQNWIPDNYIIVSPTLNRKERKILINNDFVKFIACYIVKGNTRENRVSVFTFHIEKDKHLIEFIKNYITNTFGSEVKCFMRPESCDNKVLKIEVFNSQLSNFLNDFCGHTSLNKNINNKILGASDQLLLDTLIECDGYKKGNFRTFTTISRKLAYQVLHISLGLGHSSSISKYNTHIDKNGVKHRRCYRVYITYFFESKKMGIYTKKIKEGMCLKIRDIKKREVDSTMVYNITINESHKYTIDGLLVNNCDGVGKNPDGTDCRFCLGKGKIGLNKCDTCSGEGRILGKQKLKGIKLNGDETKIELMGHYSKNGTGHLFLVKK